MPNGDPRDGFFYPTLTLMIDSYNLYRRCKSVYILAQKCDDLFYQIMCLAQGPQRSDAGEARTRYPSVSSQ